MSIATRVAAVSERLQLHSPHPLVSQYTATVTACTAGRLTAVVGTERVYEFDRHPAHTSAPVPAR